MGRSLTPQDRSAVDLFLDGGQSAKSAPSASGVAGVGGFVDPLKVDHHRVQAAANLLSMLQNLPQMAPPADLLAKTLRRIEQHIADPATNSLAAPGMMLDLPPAS